MAANQDGGIDSVDMPYRKMVLTVAVFCSLKRTKNLDPPHGEPGRPHYRSVTIALRHIAIGRTPLDE